MTANGSGKLTTAFGICGSTPSRLSETALPPGAEPFGAVKEAGTRWRGEGYDYPRRLDMQIMSLHFSLPASSGWPAGAPWFEDWKTFYQEPIENGLAETANGFPNGSHRAKGRLVLYFYILDAAAARATVEQVAALAPISFPMEVHIGPQPIRPGINLDKGMPVPLSDMYKGFEQMALTLAEASQSVVFHTVTLTPQLVHEPSRQRVKGLPAQNLLQGLRERWGFECNLWPPLGGEAKSEVAVLREWTPGLETHLSGLVQQRLQLPAYLLDCEEGIFTIAPKNIFRGVYEGVVFDAGMEWIIYFSHQNTITFGGDWLVEAVRGMAFAEKG